MNEFKNNNYNSGSFISSFSIPEIDERLRSAIEQVKGITITSIDDMYNLTGYLDLSDFNLTSLKGIEYAEKIRQLYLNNTNISDISQISGLTQLTWLEISNNNIENIEPVTDLINLTGLKINNNPIKNLSSLSSLKKLKVLRLRNISQELSEDALKSLGITSLSNITVLDLSQNGIKSIVDNDGRPLIPNLSGLLSLGLEQNNISSIDILSNLDQIRYLYLDMNKISDITPLNNKNTLKVLYLSSNNFKNFGVISSLRTLQKLYLDNLEISELGFLKTNYTLERLSLKHNYIKDLSPLSNLKSLILLNLDYNYIQTVTSLSSLKKLTNVTLDNNLISNIFPLKNTKVLLPPYNTVTANNQEVIITPPPINNNELSLSLNNSISDIDGSVPSYIKNESTGNMTVCNNILIWKEISAEDTLSFEFSNGTYSHIGGGLAKGIFFSGKVLFAYIITFPDYNLESKLLEALHKNINEPITNVALKELISLDLSYSDISNLSGLEYAVNLQEINLNNNNIYNFSPIFSLKNLVNVTGENQLIQYPIQPISINGSVSVPLDIFSSGSSNYIISLSNISDGGVRKGNKVIWKNLFGSPELTFNYTVTYFAMNPPFIDMTVSGKAVIKTVINRVSRGINIFNHKRL